MLSVKEIKLIKYYLGKNYLDLAFEFLEKKVTVKQLEKEIIQLKSRFSRIEKFRDDIALKEKDIELNQINYSLLSLISEIEELIRIENDLLDKKSKEDEERNRELANLLEVRGNAIINFLDERIKEFPDPKLEKFKDNFTNLHRKHIEALGEANLVIAHELNRSIFNLINRNKTSFDDDFFYFPNLDKKLLHQGESDHDLGLILFDYFWEYCAQYIKGYNSDNIE